MAPRWCEFRPITASATQSMGGGDYRQGVRSIRETELNNLFATIPRRDKNGKTVEYPRVAITVDRYFDDMFRLPRPSECYWMHAKIWDSPKKSRDVAPFTVCARDYSNPGDGVFRNDSKISIWNSGVASAGLDHTGGVRTEGPKFPQRPLPSGPNDKIQFVPTGIAHHIVSGTMKVMAFDYTQIDTRVWFVSFNNEFPAPK